MQSSWPFGQIIKHITLRWRGQPFYGNGYWRCLYIFTFLLCRGRGFCEFQKCICFSQVKQQIFQCPQINLLDIFYMPFFLVQHILHSFYVNGNISLLCFLLVFFSKVNVLQIHCVHEANVFTGVWEYIRLGSILFLFNF